MSDDRSPRRRWGPWSVSYAFTNWKARIAYIIAAAGIGAFLSYEQHRSLALGATLGVLAALLRIWLEVRQHEPRD